ncbi:MAG: hypothetical protein KIS67_09690 [Verrucomicrobiae bacterium]|nr:hypothetical protein [Verrucomicrobiae bacterium]
MKTSLLIIAALGLCLAGCGGKSETPTGTTNPPATSGNPLDAPGEYLGAVVKGHQKAVKTVDVATLHQAIQLFQVQEGRYPKDLDELVAEKYISKIPPAPVGMKIVYDPQAGSVKVVKE